MKKILTACLMILLALSSSAAANPSTPEQRLAALGLTLPETPAAVANYVPAVRSEHLVFLSGQIARNANGTFVSGKVGRDLTEAEAAEAARTCALQLLVALKAEVGDLSKVKRIVRVSGFVNCTDDFTTQSKVVNGASDFLVAVFGESGRHARTAIGVNALPFGAPVEIELIAEIE